MQKKIFNLLLFLVVLTIFANSVSAQSVQFPNGSFETGDLESWFIKDPVSTNEIGCNSGGTDTAYTKSITSGPTSDGFYFLDMIAPSDGLAHCAKISNIDLNTFDGNYNFKVDYNFLDSVGGGSRSFLFLFDSNTSLPNCNFTTTTMGTGASAGTLACSTPSVFIGTPYTISWRLFCTGATCNADRHHFDNFRYEKVPKMIHSVSEEGDPFPIDTNFSITNDLRLDTNNMVVPNSTCTINFDGVNAEMPFNTSLQKYEYTYSTSFPQTVSYSIGCSGPLSYTNPDANVTGTVEFVVDLSTGNKLTVTDIENVSHTVTSSEVDFIPASEENDVIFSIENNYTSSLAIPQHIFNSLIDGRQYFVYTATQSQYDAGIWVFNDSLTFGNLPTDPIQKIWNESTEKYDYSYSDTLTSGQKKFYKLDYSNPYKNFQSIGDSSEWYKVLEPQVFDGNSVSVDFYQTSTFSNIRSIYIPPIPDIFGDENSAFEFQFTAWADGSTTLSAGQTLFDSDSTSSVTLGTTPHRYSFTINGSNFNSQILLKSTSTSPRLIYIYDYAIVPRGYFTKRLDVFKGNGDFLDLFLLNGNSEKYVSEGQPFKISAEAYDKEGKLTQLVVNSYFDTTGADVNKVSQFTESLSSGDENLFSFNQVVPGIIDLNGNAVSPSQPRDMIVRATLYDDEGNAISEQSQPLKFVQFPYFGGDFFLTFFPTEKRKGKNPAGLISFDTKDLSTLEGFDVRIYDANTSLASPDYQSRIYKGIDFDCVTSNCSIQFKVNDFLFEDANIVHVVITAMLNTEYFSLTNHLIQADTVINLSQIDFDTAKIHQQIERLDKTYRNDEEIPLVLILKSSEADALKNKLEVYLTLQNCDATTAGNCATQTTKYNPTGYLYDDKYNYNYYFFRHFYLLDNGNALPDGNYVGFRATVLDKTGVTQTLTPVLASKCKNADVGSAFWNGALLSFLQSAIFGDGCNTVQEQIVTTTQNNDQEIRLLIDDNHTTTDPSQELFMCLNMDTNNVIGKPLEANLVCAAWYEVAESPVDNFRLRLSNNNSDFTNTGITKQYIEVNVPYEVVAYNDLPLLKAELEASQNTTINTVGEFFFESFRNLAKDALFTNKLNNIDEFLNGNNVITNIGADLNFNQAFSPNTIGGVVFYRLNGFPIVNAYEYRNYSEFNGNFDQLDKKQFIEFLVQENINFPNPGASMDVIVSDYSNPVTLSDPDGRLVINEVPSKQPINQSNLDSNGTSPNYAFIPSILQINVSHTMFWNSFSENETLALIVNLTLLITDNFFAGVAGFINEFSENPSNAAGDLFSSAGIWIIIGLGFVFIIALIRRNLAAAGGNGSGN